MNDTYKRPEPELTLEQEYWLCSIVDYWYLSWKGRMTDKGECHHLGVAKEQLKRMICYPEEQYAKN